jgi:uncharacterized protein YkwD
MPAFLSQFSLKVFVRFTVLSLSLVSLSATSQPASAQNLQTRPVARMITGTSNVAGISRSRRVNAETDSTGSTTSKADTMLLSAALTIDEATSIERRVFDVTNEVRQQHGLAPLTWDPDLCRMARTHSMNMGTLEFFSHEGPEGFRLRDRARASGILRFRVLAENIAYNQGYDDPGAFAVERWMISPGHRANILSQEFRASAIGSFVAKDGRVYLTQAFITR